MNDESFPDPEDVLSVSIPLEGPQRPLLGGSLLLPCHFEVRNFQKSTHGLFILHIISSQIVIISNGKSN